MRLTGPFALCLFAALAGCGDGEGGGSPGQVAPSYAVGGNVSGLTGTGLSLKNGSDTLTITANGSFSMPSKVASGASYSVTVDTYPSGPAQNCVVQNGAGTVANADVTTVTVTCTLSPSTYAYAAVPHSAAKAEIGLIEYFALDTDTGRLTRLGTLVAGDQTRIDYVKAAPSGRQLLVSSSTFTGSGRTSMLLHDDLALYDLTPATGLPTKPTLVSSPGGGNLIVHPNGVDLYAPGTTVFHYSLAAGAAQRQSLVLGSDSVGPGSAITPDGKFLFVPNSNGGSVPANSIAVISLANPLQPLLVSKLPTPIVPLNVTISGDGRLLYVTPAEAGGLGQVYAIDAAGGLTAAGTFAAPRYGRSAVVVGNLLYVASADDNKVQGYRLDGVGGVTPLGSGTSVPAAFWLRLDPSGRFLYVISWPITGDPGAIYGFAVAADGTLTAVPGSPFANGEREYDLTFVKVNP